MNAASLLDSCDTIVDFAACVRTMEKQRATLTGVRNVTWHDSIDDVPEGPAVIATGPLTSGPLYEAIEGALGDGGLAFFDAIAPIVHRESLDESVVNLIWSSLV